jgi:hypothetical protein
VGLRRCVKVQEARTPPEERRAHSRGTSLKTLVPAWSRPANKQLQRNRHTAWSCGGSTAALGARDTEPQRCAIVLGLWQSRAGSASGRGSVTV